MYYAQGVAVGVSSEEQFPPTMVVYQGGTYCAHTSIVLNLNAKPDPVLSIAFMNSVVVDVSQQEWQEAQKSVVGTAQSIIAKNGWEMYSDTLQIGVALANYFTYPQDKN